jgi:polar amino acid transport system substrate-binding protein
VSALHPLSRTLAWLLGLCLLGCASRPPAEAPPAAEASAGLTRIAQTGELRIGMTGEQPPLTMTARSGEMIGLDVALAKVLAQSMGVEPRFVRLPFNQLLDALDRHEVDLVMSGVTITPERSRRATFVGPYFTSGKSILTRSQELAAVQVPQDLDSAKLRIAALAGSTSESFVRKWMPRAQLVSSQSLDDAIQMVRNGQVDVLVADRETCAFAVLRYPDAGLINPSVTFSIEPMGIAVAPDDPRLANLVQTYLTALEERGVLDKARAFWFQDPSWVKNLR